MAARTIQIEIPITAEDHTDPAVSSAKSKLEALDKTAEKVKTSVGKSGQNTGKGFDQATKSVRKLDQELKKTTNSSKGFDKMGTEVAKGFDKSTQSVTKFGSKIKQISSQAKAFMSEKMQKVIEVKDRAMPALQKIASYGRTIAGKTWRVTVRAVDLATRPVRRLFNLLRNPLMAAGFAVGGAAVAGDVIKTYAGFESQMSKVQAISGATGEELTALTEKAKEMGASTKFTAEESGQAFEYMSMAGWKAKDMMSGIEGIMNLAAASGEDLSTTSDIVTDALTAFGLKAKDSTHFADVLAQASSNANTNVGMMGETFKYVAPVAGAMGYTIEDTALAIGLMANAGVKSSQAGTALRSMLTRLAAPPKDAAAAMEKLGLSITNSDGSMRSLNEIMADMRKGFQGLSKDEQVQTANALAGKYAMSGLLAIVNASEEDYNHLADSINNADGASKRMADTMLNNVQGKWTLFKSALDGVKLALGERFRPYLMSAIEWMTDRLPDLQNGLMKTMDNVDNFVGNMKDRWANLQNNREFQNADLFGKIKIGWDELIAKPFGEWWESKGKAKFAQKANEIGKNIGMGLSAGLLALLGIDVSSSTNDGESVGAAFAKGFASGFHLDDVMGAATGAVGGLFKNAGSLLTGNVSLSSLLSTALLARIGIPLLKGGWQVGQMGKTIFGSGGLGLGPLAAKGISSGLETSRILAMAMGSGATTTAGLTAAGLGVAGGSVAAGIAVGSGIKDLHTAFEAKKEGNDDKAKAYGGAGGMALAGVAAGATIGTIVMPGIGTAIGAGIGGITGMLVGHKMKKDYEEAAAAAENYAEKSAYALEGARFDSEDLKAAFDDTNVSAEEFANSMEKAANSKISDAFGKLSLSAQEIQDAASHILYGGNTAGLDKYANAAILAGESLNYLNESQATMSKLNWRASLGMITDSEGAEEYRSSVMEMVSNARRYIEDQHYQATAAIELLVDTDGDIDMLSGLNEMYSNLQSQIDSKKQELTAQLDIAMEDGQIDVDEQKVLADLQKEISDITNKIADADLEANMDMLKIKYSGADLDPSSFSQLMSELQTQAQTSMEQYDEALELSLRNLHLQLQEGTIDQAGFDAQLSALTSGYQANISNVGVRIESFELQSISDAFSSELDGILPDLKGTTVEKLETVMNDALANGVDFSQMTVPEISDMFDLNGLSAETQTAIATELQMVAASLPEQFKSALGDGVDLSDALSQSFKSSIDSMDTSDAATSLNEKLAESIGSTDMSAMGENSTALSTALAEATQSSIENMDTSGVGQAYLDNIGESISSIDMSSAGDSDGGLSDALAQQTVSSIENMDTSEIGAAYNNMIGESLSGTDSSGVDASGSGLSDALAQQTISSIEGMDTSEVGTAYLGKVSEGIAAADLSSAGGDGGGLADTLSQQTMAAVEGMDLSGIGEIYSGKISEGLAATEMDFSGFATAMQSGIDSSATGLTFESVTSAVGTGVASAVLASFGQIQPAISQLYSQVGSAINSAFAAGFTTTTTVTITVNYKLANPSATINFSGGGSGTATVSASISSGRRALGGFTNGPEYSLIGEDGPEAIIPLGGKRRKRGIDLWYKAGQMLGVPRHAEGGLFGNGNNAAEPDDNFSGGGSGTATEQIPVSVDSSGKASDGKNTDTKSDERSINIQMSVNPSFVIESSGAGSEQDILRTLRAHMSEVADELSGELANRLGEVFSNMPANA